MRNRFILWPLVACFLGGGIHAIGQVVGYSTNNGGVLKHAVLWKNGVPQDLGTLGGPESVANGINAAGQVVGSSTPAVGASHAFIWTNGVMQDLGTLGGPISQGNAINAAGQAVGYANNAGGATRAFRWTNGTMLDLGALGTAPFVQSYALGINASGQVVGASTVNSGTLHAFRWSNGVMQDLGTLGGADSYATGINDSGQIIGYSSTVGGATHAFLWTNGVMQDLGTLGGTSSQGRGINAIGQVVGQSTTASGDTHAFLWSNGTMQDLGTLGGTQSFALGINAAGQVVGYSATSTGIIHAFFWSNGVMQDMGTLGTATDTSEAHGLSEVPNNFTSITPCRIMDTRGNGFIGAFGTPSLAAGITRAIPIPSSSCAIPASATAYSLNVTIVPKTPSFGFLSIWPVGQPQPTVSTLNSPDGSVLANAAIVPAGVNGAVNVYASNDADLVVDINGYFSPPTVNSLMFYPLTPCRILDTRNANGTFGGPLLTANVARSFPLQASACSIPAAAQGYSLNVTVAPTGPLGFLTVWPTGQTRPLASTLNSLDGTTLANAALVPAGTNGEVSFFATNNTHLIVDINGYFAPPTANGLNFYTLTPCRVADTRNANGSFGGPILNAGDTKTIPVRQSPCGLPSTSDAYSLNITVVPSGFLGYLALWPAGTTWGGVSTLNSYKGIVIANAALVPAGANGAVNVSVPNPSHVVMDVNGYFGK